jgi:anaphase-promoting complex subunit 1
MTDVPTTWQPSYLWQADHHHSCLASDDSAPSHGLSQVVLEGSLVNLDVTSPGATLAVTLMFLKSNDTSVANMLALPDTTFTLDFVRPFYILLRILARALIMWDSMEPTIEWVRVQLPTVLRMSWQESLQPMKDAVSDGKEFDWEAVLLGHIHAVAGAALALGLRYAGMLCSNVGDDIAMSPSLQV